MWGVIGDPIEHSQSPAIHNAAIQALSLDAVYVPFHVPSGSGAEALASIRDWGIRNLNVTMPHKEAAWEACTHLDPAAKLLQSVNTICVRGSEVRGYCTDGLGVIGALTDLEATVNGSKVLVLGAGGTGRAAVQALAAAGANVIVSARRDEQARVAAELGSDVSVVSWAAIDEVHPDIVVQTTPIGMAGEDDTVISVQSLPEHAVVLDAVYARGQSALVTAARARQLRAANGLGMLVHQAAASFSLFSGQNAPLAEMRAAIDSTLGQVAPTYL